MLRQRKITSFLALFVFLIVGTQWAYAQSKKLPQGHEIVITVIREKGGKKKKLPEGREIAIAIAREKEAAVSKINLSGCWVDDKGRKITIHQEGSKVLATYPYFGRVFTGSLNKDKVTLLYIFKDVNDYASVHWVKYYEGNRPIPHKVLAQALSKQRKYDYGFELKVTNENELTGNLLNMNIQWDWDTGELTDFSSKTDSAIWRRQKIKLK